MHETHSINLENGDFIYIYDILICVFLNNACTLPHSKKMKKPEEAVKKVENRINDDSIWRQIIETEVFGSLDYPYNFLKGGYIGVCINN